VNPIAERAKELLPAVLLTLASIIQALSLEVLWEGAQQAPHLWIAGPTRFAGWLQVAGTFLAVMLVWVYYAQLVMRFRWVPTLRDSLIPFGFGLGQFALGELLRADRMHAWLYVVSGLFVYATWASTATLRAAQADPDNAWYVAIAEQGLVARFGIAAATVLALFGLGAITHRVGGGGAWGVAAMLAANAILLFQLVLQRRYWSRSVLASRDPDATHEPDSPRS
jgi:hypothetical protein